jgi:hypothetical protein
MGCHVWEAVSTVMSDQNALSGAEEQDVFCSVSEVSKLLGFRV